MQNKYQFVLQETCESMAINPQLIKPKKKKKRKGGKIVTLNENGE